MHYVILRDDDTCACTPHACLERLYRPFLERGMPVNLAVIPEVRTSVRMADGKLEGFLAAGLVPDAPLAPIGRNRELVEYLRGNPGFQVAQHGCHHDLFEFGASGREELARRLDRGALLLREAGFARPPAFVAPYDRLSRAAFDEVAGRFDVISTGWFEARRVPFRSWPQFALKKLGRRSHWRMGGKYLLSHPGCLLSYTRPRAGMLASVREAVEGAALTVLVVHWWEFFREGTPDDGLIGVLHEAAAWLSSRRDIRVVSFGDVAAGRVPLS
jgi:Uncharacterized protein conserved in bacteria (DUF2334)